MGLFGSKKTYVSSTIYNLAGDINDRPDYLKSLIASNVISNRNFSVGDVLREGYKGGPGVGFRSFFRWAVNNYQTIGVPVGRLNNVADIDTNAVASAIPHDSNEQVDVEDVQFGLAEYSYWADQWMLDNRPDEIDTEWESDFNETSGEILITFADGGSVSFMPQGFQRNAYYVYAPYSLGVEGQVEPIEEGEQQPYDINGPIPDLTGYAMLEDRSVPFNWNGQVLTRETRNYSDGRPDEVTETMSDRGISTTDPDWTAYLDERIHEDDTLIVRRHLFTLYARNRVEIRSDTTTRTSVVDGVTVTITTMQEYPMGIVEGWYRQDTQDTIVYSWGPRKLFIYRIGSGNEAIDEQFEQAPGNDGDYFPFIPLRLNNRFLSTSYLPDAYELAEKAYKKSVNGKLDEVIQDLAENENIADIDYAYVMFGVSLNTKEKAAKKYLYRFFNRLMLSQGTDNSQFTDWMLQEAVFTERQRQWNEWSAAQGDPNNPLFGTPEPVIPSYSALPVSEVRIRSTGSVPSNVNMVITWSSITEDVGTGLGQPDAKVGDVWITNLGNLPIGRNPVGRFTITWQDGSNSWRRLTVVGMVHKNYIYNGKYVEIGSDEALKDTEESGFLVPIHYDTLKEMSLVDSTQMATASCYLVLNSYLVKKTGFFQSGFFKIIAFVAVIALTVVTGGIGGASVGILGTNAAVGAALGLTGLAGIIAGAVANAIVATLIIQAVTMGATAVFGDKIGAVIGMIAGVVAVQVGTSMTNGQGLAASFSNLTRADNIINLTNAAGNGYAAYVRASVMDTVLETQKLQQDYEKESQEISDAYAANIGYDRAVLNPLGLTDVSSFVLETGDSFLSRTLMTGSEIADMSLNMLSRFSEITLSTELPNA